MIFVHQEADNLIRVRLQSRHTSSKTYLLWIEYSPTEVTAWYCKCRAGARVVGSMLSHHVHRVVPWICKTQTAYILRSKELGGGGHLEDASHVIDHTDSDQSVIEE